MPSIITLTNDAIYCSQTAEVHRVPESGCNPRKCDAQAGCAATKGAPVSSVC